MSGGRFWLQDDDSDEDLYSSGDEVKEEQKAPQSRFNFDFDEDEEEEKRVVRSAKDKKLDEMQQSIKKLKNSMKINDWNALSTEWESLSKIHEKAKSVFDKEGTPKQLIHLMYSLEELMTKTQSDKEAKDRMSSTSFKSFNFLKQKFKKWAKTSGFDKLIEEYRKNPGKDEDDEEPPAKKDTKAAKEPATGAASPAKGAKADADSDFDEDYSESDEEPEDEDKAAKPTSGRTRWLKKPGQESSSDEEGSDFDEDWDDEEKEKRRKDEKEKKKKEEKEKKAKKAEEAAAPSDKPATKPEEKPEEWNADKVDKKIKELLSKRGTRNYDRLKQVQSFQFLIEKTKTIVEANTPERIIRILFHLVDAQFDANPNMATFLPVVMWKLCFNTIAKLLELLKQQGDKIKLLDVEPDHDAPATVIRGPLLAHIERLGDEFNKSLLNMDPHTQDYIVRLRDEVPYLKLVKLALDHFASKNDTNAVSVLNARRLEHLYYKRQRQGGKEPEVKKDEPKAEATPAATEQATEITDPAFQAGEVKIKEEPLVELDVPADPPLQQLVDVITRTIYKQAEDKLKRKCMLQHIYSLAVHDEFFQARDMLLMSHLQETVHTADTPTQILFNRVLVQLGLAAFRKGRVSDAHNYLTDIVSNKTKELLAQGINPKIEKTQEQERKMQANQVPYPQHINLDLIECVSLICALLLEVPNMAGNPHDPKKRIISRNFRKAIRMFNGTPENNRDNVIIAAKALGRGEWKRCADILNGLEFWRLIANADGVKTMLRRKIQEEGLRTYLFTFSQHYDAIALEELVALFELDSGVVRAIVSKMILNDELQASWDQPNNAIVVHHAEASHVQYLALQFADKAAYLVDSESGDARPGYKSNWEGQDRRGYQQSGRGGRGGYGGYSSYGNFQRGQGPQQQRQGYQQGGYQQGGYQQGGYQQGGYQQRNQPRQGGYQQRY